MAQPVASLRWEAVLLVAVAAFALVGSVGTRGQAQAVDLAAVWAGLAGALAAALMVRAQRPEERYGRLATAWAALLAWMLIAALASGRGWSAIAGEPTNMLGWGTLLALTLVAIAGAAYARDVREVLRRYGLWVLLGQLVLAAMQIVGGAVPAGTLANSTYLGEATLLLLPFTVGDAEPASSQDRWLRAAVALFAILVLAASGSRVAVAVAVVWALWLVLRQRTLAPIARISVAGGVVVAVALAANAFARDEVFGFGGGALGERPAIWRLAAEATGLRPIIGWGPDGFLAGASHASSVALARAGQTLTLRPGSTDPHNLLAWVAVSAGIVGVALFAWFAIEVVLRWRRLAGPAGGSSAARWAVIGCVVVFMTAPAALQILPLFALALGASLGSSPLSSGFSAPKWAHRATLVVLALASLLVASDSAVRAAYENFGAGEAAGKATGSLSASRIYGFDGQLAYLASMHAGFAATNQQTAKDRADLTSIAHARALDQRNAFYAHEYARTLEFYGEPQAVVDKAYAEVFARYPAFPLARAEYAVFLAKNGRSAQAEEQIDIAVQARDSDAERDRAVAAARELLGAAGR